MHKAHIKTRRCIDPVATHLHAPMRSINIYWIKKSDSKFSITHDIHHNIAVGLDQSSRVVLVIFLLAKKKKFLKQRVQYDSICWI